MTASELMDRCDFAVESMMAPQDAPGVADAVRAATADGVAVRLCGLGSRQSALPAPATGGRPVRLLSLASLDHITRLEPDDLTCSVEPGLGRAALDAALAERGLELACGDRSAAPGDGSVGGLFATGRDLPRAPGGPSTRSTLLGISGVLAEGRRFKAGSKVVKSVAGFDLQKVFVGSRGRLFAVTELHLKLRRRPATRVAFASDDLDLDGARQLLLALMGDSFPAEELLLERPANGPCRVVGRWAGAATACAERLRTHGLHEVDAGIAATPRRALPDCDAAEQIDGTIRPSRCDQLATLADGCDLQVGGGGGFHVISPGAEFSDALFAGLPDLGAAGCLTRGTPQRRALATPLDPGAALVTDRLRETLDPQGLLS